MRHLYLAATGQNRGKTTASMGLLDLFLGEGLRTGFMKPVGQRTVVDESGVPPTRTPSASAPCSTCGRR